MNEQKEHINHYSQEDIRRYLDGKMNAKEMHAFEKAALEDPFLADAIEGYSNTDAGTVKADLQELEKKLADRVDEKVIPINKNKNWWKIAIAAILLISAGTISYYIVNEQKEMPSVAQANETAKKDSGFIAVVPAINDSSASVKPANTEIDKKPEVAATNTKENETVSIKAKESVEENAGRSTADNTKINQQKNDIKNAAEGNAPSANNNQRAVVELKKDNKAENTDVAGVLSKPAASPGYRINVFKGQVLNKDKQPVPFANINIANSGSSTYTDAKGNFNIVAADSLLNVQVKSIGYTSLNASLRSDLSSNQLLMQPSGNALNEVVVANKKNASRNKSGYFNKPFTEKQKEQVKTDSTESEIPEAEPVDGWANYNAYLMNNIRQPAESKNYSSHGTVEISFIVDTNGKLSEFRVERRLCSLCDREAIRLIKEGPAWELVSGNKPVRTYLSIVF